ncbi:hypothetical protein [Thermosipho sp. (in: thermotogales)]|jgi:hypothetical protein|uniref:hypothetical protein n=1 Tax=Thermosipho sp. (in: thermotogales) TaxID=1968895 RepID=UPI002580697F|nr:hypothetical protein [Thermosipho sp. (in: thermotogales)]MBZ4649220.1 hypothetical protein [Thermosipho sp. (in: thermotogales)]
MAENKEKFGFDKTLKEIKNLVKDRLSMKENTTGNSFFSGSDRFCKLVKTGKEGVYLELNVKLSDTTIKKLGPNLQTFSKVEASKKHLGTLVHILKSNDEAEVKEALHEAWKNFQDMVNRKGEEKKEASTSKTIQKSGKSKLNKKNKKASVAASEVVTRKMTQEDLDRLNEYKKKKGKIEIAAQAPVETLPVKVEDRKEENQTENIQTVEVNQ